MKDYFGQEVKEGDWVFVSFSSKGRQGTHQIIKRIEGDTVLCTLPKEYSEFTWKGTATVRRWSNEFVKAPDGWEPKKTNS